jgi:DNA-binding IclR family transcriptional regulator
VLPRKNSVVTSITQRKGSLTIRSRIGDRVPIYAAAGAKAMIAYYDPDPVEAILAEEMRRFTTQTITDLKTLKRELEKAKKQGVAFSREEISVGVNAI